MVGTGADEHGGEAPEARDPVDRRSPRFGPGLEFDLIRRFVVNENTAGVAEGAAPAGRIRVGPGDDCAVLEGGIVLSSDLSVEDVHFRRAWLDPVEIGFRAAGAALSDLAAMAALPIGVMASLAVPEAEAESLAPEVMRGVRLAADSVGTTLIGGDFTRSPGPILLDIIAIGEADAPVLRSGAQAGDALWVTGTLGGAGAAVRAWLNGATPTDTARKRFARPQPRIREARWLAERNIPRAMLDLSDGLAGDAAHLSAANGVAIMIAQDTIPIDPAALEFASSHRDALDLALSGGEDYELCFAARPGAVEAVAEEFEGAFNLRLTRVGTLSDGKGVHISIPGGGSVPLHSTGFQHFGVPG